MVQDLVYNLCESLVENIDGIDTGKKPTPITYLTQWQMMGNSEVHGNEIWSCGEYSEVDGKYHILVQPLGGSIADIALTEPLRKINNIAADKIEFANNIATVTRYLKSVDAGRYSGSMSNISGTEVYRYVVYNIASDKSSSSDRNVLMAEYSTSRNPYSGQDKSIRCSTTSKGASLYDERYNQSDSAAAFKAHLTGMELIYELESPTTELIEVPQIAEAESYTCVISQGGKAIGWSSFET